MEWLSFIYGATPIGPSCLWRLVNFLPCCILR
uniref:Uncharacterized protein n=1 Tax=Arundo donax TaxID=35708 RepID=A0A0A8YPJ2_ARUDO